MGFIFGVGRYTHDRRIIVSALCCILEQVHSSYTTLIYKTSKDKQCFRGLEAQRLILHGAITHAQEPLKECLKNS